jgi:hypothetical protein
MEPTANGTPGTAANASPAPAVAGAPAAQAAPASPPAASTQAAASQPTGGAGGAGNGAQAGAAAGQTGGGSSNPAAAGVQQAAAQAAATGSPADIAEYQRQLADYQRREAEYQRAMPYAQLGYQAWQEQQRAAQAQRQQQAEKPWFGLPAFNRAVMQFVRTNPTTGELEATAGAPPDALSQYQQFSSAFREWQIEFATNPQKFLQEPIQQIAAAVAQQIVEQRLGGFQQQTAASQIAQSVASWAYQTGPDGARQWSPKGLAYAQAIEQAEREYGIADPTKQHSFAMRFVNAQFGGPAAQAASAPQQNVAAQTAFLAAAAAGQQGAGPATPPNSATPPVAGGQGPTTLRDQLRNAFNANGITDRDFAAKQ